jgi:hypothetical protein
MMEDSAVETPKQMYDKKLGLLAELVREQRDIENTISDYTSEIEELLKKLKDVSEFKIPDLFDELGFDKITLKDGSKVEVKRGYAATITEENFVAAFNWLKETENDGIIKHDVIIKLKKGETEEHKKIIETLNEQGLTYEDKEHIHPATLKSFVNEQMTKGSDIPQDVFKIFPIRKTKIKE